MTDSKKDLALAPVLYVVGTGERVGTSTVACAVASALRRRNAKLRVLKPTETGCPRGSDSPVLVPRQAFALAKAAGDESAPNAICPHRYIPAVPPGVAAEATCTGIGFPNIKNLAEAAKKQADLVLFESTGGLLAPMGDERLQADLIALVGAQVLIVARSDQGTINDTLLMISELRRRNLPIAGVVFDRVSAEPVGDEIANQAFVQRFGRLPLLGLLPHLEPKQLESIDALAEAAEANLRISDLVRNVGVTIRPATYPRLVAQSA